jgi:hypothetical protein
MMRRLPPDRRRGARPVQIRPSNERQKIKVYQLDEAELRAANRTAVFFFSKKELLSSFASERRMALR